MRPLYGNYEVTIDDKNRMLVPAEVRKNIDPQTDGAAFFLVTGVNGRLWLYPERQYEQYALHLASELAPEEDQLAFDQINFAMASRVEWDKQGRILIPEKVLRKAQLGKEVTVIGMRDHAELWNRRDWERQEEELERRRAEITVKARQKQLQQGQSRDNPSNG